MTDDNSTDQATSNNQPLKMVFTARESNFEGANDEDLRQRLALLELEHSDLDAAISAMELSPYHNRLAIARTKKRKLQLKDLIEQVRNKVTPDIIA